MTEPTIKSDKEKIKNIKNDIIIDRCEAATHIVVKYAALKRSKKNKVYIITEDINGESKQRTYQHCSRTATFKKDGYHFCESHNKSKTPKIFKEDILPINDSGISKSNIRSSLVTGNEEYFDKAKKKIISSITFKNDNDPVYLCLNNLELSSELKLYAISLLKRNGAKIESNILLENSEKNIDTNKLSLSSSLLNNINELKKSFEKSSLSNNDKNDNTNDDNIDELSINNNITELDISDSDSINSNEIDDNTSIDKNTLINNDLEENENENENENQDETECIEIYTKKNKLLYLDKTNSVFESEDGCDAVEIGRLTKIDEKYSTIIHEYQQFTVMKDIKCPETHTDLKLCVLSDKVFDTNLKHIGRITKSNNNSFKIILKKLQSK